MSLNQGYSYRHVLDLNAIGQTPVSYLASRFPHSTAAEWQSRLSAGEILLDDRPAHAGEALRPGSILVWNRPGWVEDDTPQSFGLIYHDADLLVVDKPSGLPTLPGAGFLLNTLLSLVQRDFPEARPLHRLGRATSGLVLFAVNVRSASVISQCWSQVQKTYRALASGVASQEHYDIQVPIGPVPHPRLGQVHAACPTGKPARSIARPLLRNADSTLFEVDLRTGRPHQIRIHLAAIGHPLVGDPLYAKGGLPQPESPGLPGDPGYRLHAWQLRLEHPALRRELEFQAPVPWDAFPGAAAGQ